MKQFAELPGIFQYRAATNWNKLPVSVRSNFSDMSLNEFEGVIWHNIVIL